MATKKNQITANDESSSNKQISEQIAKCGTLSKKLENEIQATLIMILVHKGKYGDWSGYIRLIDAISGAVRKNSIKAWVEQCTNVEFPRGEKPRMNRDKSDMDVAEAIKVSWVDADGKEPEYKPLKWENQAEKLLTKLQSDIDHGLASLSSLESLIVGLQVGLAKKQAAAEKAALEAEALKVKAA